MGRTDWDYVNLPKLLVKRLDQFLETPRAKSMGLSSKSELLRHLINQYLDEQEALYNNIQYIKDFVLQVRDRDHLILAYNETAQLQEILCAYLERGVKNNQISVLNIFKNEEPLFIGALQKCDMNIDSMFNSQDITIISADESFHAGQFSLEPFTKSLDQTRDLAKRKGRSGLNILSTLPGNLVEQGKYEEAIADEQSTHELAQKYEIPTTVVCLYKSIPNAVAERLSACHDVIIKRVVATK
jgi:hypothetical protein